MVKMKVMISSTVSDLEAERDAAKKIFNEIPIVELVGANPLNVTAVAGSSRVHTVKMAKECDLYILILGNRFGYEVGNGKSATEIEFDAAFKDDPTKILVFYKECDEKPDDNQKRFIDKVSDYSKGYWRTSFKYTHDLQTYLQNSFETWLIERASIGTNLNYLDHFVRIAIQTLPEDNSEVYYKVTENDVELEYGIFGNSYEIHFSRQEIYQNFWGCITSLHKQFEVWQDEMGGEYLNEN